MKVIEESFQLHLPKSVGRSGGLHVSDIIRDLALKTGVLDAKYDRPILDTDSEMVQVGLAWENYLAEYQHPEIVFHGSEIVLDGIAMSPDGISSVDADDYAEAIGIEQQEEQWILHEFKATKKTSRDFKESMRLRSKKCLMWLWQIESYRNALNKLYPDKACTLSKLHVLFVNGNYSRDEADPESGISYKIFKLVHTPQELDDTWTMILSHADTMRGRN